MALDANALLFLQETLTQNDGADVKALQATFTENGLTSLDDFRKVSKDDLAEMKVPIGLRNRFLAAMTRLRPNNTIAPEGGQAAPAPPAPAPQPQPVPAPVAPKPPQKQPVPQQPKLPVNNLQTWVCPACTSRCPPNQVRCATCGTLNPNAKHVAVATAATASAGPPPSKLAGVGLVNKGKLAGAAAGGAGGAAAAGNDDDDDDPFAQWRNGGQHQQHAPAAAAPPSVAHVVEPCDDPAGDGPAVNVPHAAVVRPLLGVAPAGVHPGHAVRR